MNTTTRVSLYGLGLVAAFGTAFLVASAVVPPSALQQRPSTAEAAHGETTHGETGETTAAPADPAAEPTRGVTVAAGGFLLSSISAPYATGEEGELSFAVLDADGEAVVDFTESHEKELHLIVVRTDGQEFRHVHPELSVDGTWSLPWSWATGGSYRVFADFVPEGEEDAITLTRSVDVAGDFAPADVHDQVREVEVDGYTVELSGDLHAGSSSTLTLEVSRDGAPVTTIEPYLGAFGHLVALRDGDLAYLHVHPEGTEPEPGATSGPQVEFATEAPTPGRYLLYFDFKVDGQVRTAAFVLETTTQETAGGDDSHSDDEDSH